MYDIAIFSSSGLSHDFSKSIKVGLSKLGYHAETWKKNVFKPGNSTINCITDHLKKCDFAVVILSKDDIVVKDKSAYGAPRDNVILELGLCIGILGLNRTIYLYDQGAGMNIKLPTDLDGITGISYVMPVNARPMAEICAKVKNRIVELGARVKSENVIDFKPFVEIYYHKSNFTKLQASKIKETLAEKGVLCEIKSHLKNQNPDSIFIGTCVPAHYVKTVLNLVPYEITHIFRADYPDSEGGDSNGFKIGIGFSSTYNQQDASLEAVPVPLTARQLAKIKSKKITNTELHCFLHKITLKP